MKNYFFFVLLYTSCQLVSAQPANSDDGPFLPTPQQLMEAYEEAAVRKSSDSLFQLESQHHTLVFDYQTEKVHHIVETNKDCLKKKKNLHFIDNNQDFHFRINNLPTHLNPQVTVTISGETLFQERSAQFGTDLEGIAQNQSEPVGDNGEVGVKTDSLASAELQQFEELSRDLQRFYQKGRKTADQQYLQMQIHQLSSNIERQLNLEEASPETLREKGMALLRENMENRVIEPNSVTHTAYLKYIEEVVIWYQSILHLPYQHYYSGSPVQTNGKDVIKVDWMIQTDGNDYVRTEPYELYVCNRWKWDISIGLIGTDLVDERYFFKSHTEEESTDDDNENGDEEQEKKFLVITKSETGNFKIGMGVLAHFYKKSCNGAFSPGFAMGTKLKFDDEDGIRPRFLVGISLSIGRKRERIVFSGGVAYGPVRRLQSSFQEGDRFDFTDGQAMDIPYRNHWKDAGFFIGITYNMLGQRD